MYLIFFLSSQRRGVPMFSRSLFILCPHTPLPKKGFSTSRSNGTAVSIRTSMVLLSGWSHSHLTFFCSSILQAFSRLCRLLNDVRSAFKELYERANGLIVADNTKSSRENRNVTLETVQWITVKLLCNYCLTSTDLRLIFIFVPNFRLNRDKCSIKNRFRFNNDKCSIENGQYKLVD